LFEGNTETRSNRSVELENDSKPERKLEEATLQVRVIADLDHCHDSISAVLLFSRQYEDHFTSY
jgi:hypothetical protein